MSSMVVCYFEHDIFFAFSRWGFCFWPSDGFLHSWGLRPGLASVHFQHNDFSVGGHVNGVSIKPYTDMPAESVLPHYTVSLCSFGLSGSSNAL